MIKAAKRLIWDLKDPDGRFAWRCTLTGWVPGEFGKLVRRRFVVSRFGAAGRAVAVQYHKDGQDHRLVADREIVLSGGAYNTPHGVVLNLTNPAATEAEIAALEGVLEEMGQELLLRHLWQ